MIEVVGLPIVWVPDGSVLKSAVVIEHFGYSIQAVIKHAQYSGAADEKSIQYQLLDEEPNIFKSMRDFRKFYANEREKFFTNKFVKITLGESLNKLRLKIDGIINSFDEDYVSLLMYDMNSTTPGKQCFFGESFHLIKIKKRKLQFIRLIM